MAKAFNIPAGSPVHMVSGGETMSVAEYGTTGQTLQITKFESPQNVAPAGVWFEVAIVGSNLPVKRAGGVYDPRMHEIHYEWSFGDPGTWSVLDHMPDAWKNRNIGYGQYTAHTYAAPGTYTVTCTARTRTGVIATGSIQVTVGDPDVFFAGNTHVVSNQNNFTGAPAGTQHTSMLAARDAVTASGQPGRILLKRGEDYMAENWGRYTQGNVFIAPWGSGDRPKIMTCSTYNLPENRGYTISGIEVVGGWDSTTCTGVSGREGIVLGGLSRHATVYDCEFYGHGNSIYANQNPESWVFVVSNCLIRDWQNFGILTGDGGRQAFRGMRVTSHPLALGGGMGKGDLHNYHGPIRWGNWQDQTATLLVDQFECFSNMGWTTLTNQRLGNIPAHQACFRTSAGQPKHKVALYRFCGEGGSDGIVIRDTAASALAAPQNTLIDKVYMLGSAASFDGVYVQLGGTTVRNTVVVQPNVESMGSGSGAWRYGIGFDLSDEVDGNRDTPVALYSNTVVSDLTGVNAQNDVQYPTFIDHARYPYDGNNASYLPGQASPITSDGVLNGEQLFTPRFVSHQWEPEPTPDTSFATPTNAARIPRLPAGSAAIGSADNKGRIAVDDFFGNIRPVVGASRGAIEPT